MQIGQPLPLNLSHRRAPSSMSPLGQHPPGAFPGSPDA